MTGSDYHPTLLLRTLLLVAVAVIFFVPAALLLGAGSLGTTGALLFVGLVLLFWFLDTFLVLDFVTGRIAGWLANRMVKEKESDNTLLFDILFTKRETRPPKPPKRDGNPTIY